MALVPQITPQILLEAYAAGLFPMAENADDPHLYWIEPELRGVLPLKGFHVPASLGKKIRKNAYRVICDHNFGAVMDGCASRETTWINERIRHLYHELFEAGFCHSVEVYDQDRLIGGLYGVKIRGAFFGESMFHDVRDASRIALVHLVSRLVAGGFRLLDTQFMTEHLRQFGGYEIPQKQYLKLLEQALSVDADFYRFSPEETMDGALCLQLISQAS